jgi:hypothetical protein
MRQPRDGRLFSHCQSESGANCPPIWGLGLTYVALLAAALALLAQWLDDPEALRACE